MRGLRLLGVLAAPIFILSGCFTWHVYYQRGGDTRFMEAAIEPLSNKLLASYGKNPDILIKRLQRAGATCAKTVTETICVFFRVHIVHSGTRIWVWKIADGGAISAQTHIIDGNEATSSTPKNLRECGPSFKASERAYLRHLGGKIDCEAKASANG